MATSNEIISARNAYSSICAVLDARNWTYDKDDENLRIDVGVNGEDLPMDIVISVDAEYQLVKLQSLLPFKIEESKRVEGSIATNYINFQLANGSFDYSIYDGSVAFRLTQSFRDSYIVNSVYNYMIDIACQTIDKFNDALLMLSKGMMDLKKFFEITDD